jgi:phage host-nuclease inhibitor protein Gam
LKVAEETAKITRDYLPKLAEIDMEIKALREEMAR